MNYLKRHSTSPLWLSELHAHLSRLTHTVTPSTTMPTLPNVKRRHALRLIHYNDVYNINTGSQEPTGGASRFITAINETISQSPVETVVLFSGDAFSPAPLTSITKGEEIPPILNASHIKVACLGNHELDNGIEVLKQRLSETNFTWICSNVTDNTTGERLLGLRDRFVLEVGGVRMGFVGLAGLDWLDTLNCVDNLSAEDFLEVADRVGEDLRNDDECDVVVALTHMRQPDDLKLAADSKFVDLVLGGHDHVMWKRFINGRWVLKSGTDFKNFSTIDVYVEGEDGGNKDVVFEQPVFHNVTSKYKPHPVFEQFVNKQLSKLGKGYFDKLAICTTELDGRFVSIRTRETELGNLITDAMAGEMRVTIGLINAGSFRSDCIEPSGIISKQTIDTILPFQDEIIICKFTGSRLLSALNNSVSQYPLLDGRFLQVSGIKFKFNPNSKIRQQRVYTESVRVLDIDGEWNKLEMDGIYQVATKTYLFDGKDGYESSDQDSDIVEKGECPLPTMFLKYLKKLSEGGEVVVLSPVVQGRIVCEEEDEGLLRYYSLPAQDDH